MADTDTKRTSVDSRVETRTGYDFALHSVVVAHEDGPDECTIYPRRRDHCGRTTRWLTADLAVFVDLADAC